MSFLTIVLSVCMLSSLFFCILAAKSFVLVRFKIIRWAIVSLAALKVSYRRVNLGKSRVLLQDKDISSSTFEICSICPGAGGIWPERKHFLIGVLALAEIPLSVWQIDILPNTDEIFYGISPVARNVDCIFRVIVLFCQAFCIKEMKSALSMFYVVNRVFSASNVL